ncbi:MAG: hypothetical protein PHY79_21320 [Anaerolineae bacterium]|nr:hypothetical protein [Anaerolineae bacterium]MDX9829030.1 hypothetical protein [Anaerolineae bacterium]
MEQKGFEQQQALDRADEDKVIPWAEGNGLWGALTRLASDLIGADLVAFFVDNPYANDTAQGLAVRVGRQPFEVGPVLDALVQDGFLDVVEMGGLRVYLLTEESHRRQTLQQYATWLREGFHWARLALER